MWSIRYKNKGTCSTSVANRIFKKLRSFPTQDRKQALENAIAGGWKDLFPIKKSKFEQEAENVPKPKYFKASDQEIVPTLAELGKTAEAEEKRAEAFKRLFTGGVTDILDDAKRKNLI